MLEENSVILQAQNISRFLNYTSGIFLYPLRFSANFGNIETHNGKFFPRTVRNIRKKFRFW